jgi:integrase
VAAGCPPFPEDPDAAQQQRADDAIRLMTEPTTPKDLAAWIRARDRLAEGEPAVIDDATIDRIAERLAARPTPRVLRDVPLDDATWKLFIAWLKGNGYTGQCKLSGWHKKSLGEHFGVLSAICETSKVDAYKAARLDAVAPRSVELELGTLGRFLAFAEAQRWIVHPPAIAPLSAKAVGNKLPTSKDGAVPTTPAQMEAIIRLLPEQAKRPRAKGDRLTRIRGPFVVVYDLMLRPAQVEGLMVPKHWTPGMRELRITPEIDKNRCSRPVPLSARALAACEDAYRDLLREGRIPRDGSDVPLFGTFKHSSRPYLKDAARKAGVPEREAKHFSSYDFKHSGVSHLAATPGESLAGISSLSGVSPETLSRRYLHTNLDQARELVARRDARRESEAKVLEVLAP